jgi:hypothetical protein
MAATHIKGIEVTEHFDEPGEFVLPAGTVCRLSGVPFELATETRIWCHPENYKLLISQSLHTPVKPCHAAALPVMSTTNSSSFESNFEASQSRTCVGVEDVSTIHVESKQCQ